MKPTEFPIVVALIAAACGGSAGPSLIGSDSDCPAGEIPVTSRLPGAKDDLCVAAPPSTEERKAFLAIPEYEDGEPYGITLTDTAPRFDCVDDAAWPRTEVDSDREFSLTGLVTKVGKARKPVGLCVSVLSYEAMIASECAAQAAEGDATCFSQDPCAEGRDVFGPGVVLGSQHSVDEPGDEEVGRYTIGGLPAGKNLVIRVAGPLAEWRHTYKYGVFVSPDEIDRFGGTLVAEASIISKATWQTFPATAGVPGGIQPGNGAIAGTVADCGGTPEGTGTCNSSEDCSPGAACSCETVDGLEVDGYVCVPSADEGTCVRAPWSLVGATVGFSTQVTAIAYFQGREGDNLPQPGRPFTNIMGTFAGMDAPPGRTQLVAMAHVGDADIVAGRAEVFIVPDTVAVFGFRGAWTGHFPWYL